MKGTRRVSAPLDPAFKELSHLCHPCFNGGLPVSDWGHTGSSSALSLLIPSSHRAELTKAREVGAGFQAVGGGSQLLPGGLPGPQAPGLLTVQPYPPPSWKRPGRGWSGAPSSSSPSRLTRTPTTDPPSPTGPPVLCPGKFQLLVPYRATHPALSSWGGQSPPVFLMQQPKSTCSIQPSSGVAADPGSISGPDKWSFSSRGLSG